MPFDVIHVRDPCRQLATASCQLFLQSEGGAKGAAAVVTAIYRRAVQPAGGGKVTGQNCDADKQGCTSFMSIGCAT